ncbi:MAG: hypothetical protein HC772_20240 [Leptolyngbyaceae cyanobacterium CRU_2_3]|nr:hypothetical protein [Leptolyngbyaceae cyanobacterium CRU_2_3]
MYNDSASRLLGFQNPHPLLGQPLGQPLDQPLGQPAGRDYSADLRNQVLPALQIVLATGQSAESEVVWQRDRQDESEPCYLTFSHTPIRLETGECGGAFTTLSLIDSLIDSLTGRSAVDRVDRVDGLPGKSRRILPELTPPATNRSRTHCRFSRIRL